ncbi:MAG: hypothetical protein MUF83_02305 [Acidimicrobiales bacterium]|jgi:hypothetical protein|nr:hypothetical protein [Acidimicrobiales bacterium]
MEAQLRLLDTTPRSHFEPEADGEFVDPHPAPRDWALDERTRSVGRRGVAHARAELAAAARRRQQDDHGGHCAA